MKSRHLVDPELVASPEGFPSLDFRVETLPALRARRREQAAHAKIPENLPVSVESIEVPGPPGAPDVRILAYAPTGIEGRLPALVHFHGGGFVMGLPEMKDAAHRLQAVDLGCAIYSVDYRLAPETRFPGSVEDCYAALQWLTSHAEERGIDTSRIGLKGESAGGALAASVALMVRDRGELSIAFQQLISPMLDDRTPVNRDTNPYAGEFGWTRANDEFGWSALLGKPPGSDAVSPYASPARADDLKGLPPTFLSIGALDLLLEESLEYARRLTRAGVPVELHVYPGSYHGFASNFPSARVSIAAERDSREALRRSFHG